MRQARVAVDARAVEFTMRVAAKFARRSGRGSPIADLHLDSVQRRAVRQGTTPIVKRDSKAAEWMVWLLLRRLGEAQNEARKDRLRGVMRSTFGDAAYFRALTFVQRAHRAAEATTKAVGEPVPSRKWLGAGVHVAPFLSHDGHIVLVAVDLRGHVAYMAGCGEPKGGLVNGGMDGNEFTAKSEDIDLLDSGAEIMSALRGEYVEKQKDGRIENVYGDSLLFVPGVHTAPWRPWNQSEGFCLLAIDHQHRLVAMMDAANPPAARSARRELLAMLEAFAPEPYHDPYEDGYETDLDDGCGEGWKRRGPT